MHRISISTGITVHGVVEVSNKLQAIVKLPNQTTYRYVSEGQRLLDGQVLVKKIEIYSDSEPLVVLEQNSIKLSRAVGEEPVKPEVKSNTDKPRVAVLNSPLSLTNSLSSAVQLPNHLHTAKSSDTPLNSSVLPNN